MYTTIFTHYLNCIVLGMFLLKKRIINLNLNGSKIIIYSKLNLIANEIVNEPMKSCN